jgi:hypothetical protein
MAIGAGTGAALGGAAGAGEGQGFVDSASRAAVGAGVGGALGGAAPAVIEGVVRGARAVAQPVANAVRGIRNVDDEAARRVVTALERDRAIDPQATGRLTPNEFAASVQSGGPASIMDIGGETTRGADPIGCQYLAGGQGGPQPGDQRPLRGPRQPRDQLAAQTFHYPDAAAQQEAMGQVQRTVNGANYRRAMRAGDRPIMSPELDRLMGSPAVVEAMRRASTSGKDRAITQGMGAMRQGVTVENGVVQFTRAATARRPIRTLPFGMRPSENWTMLPAPRRARGATARPAFSAIWHARSEPSSTSTCRPIRPRAPAPLVSSTPKTPLRPARTSSART